MKYIILFTNKYYNVVILLQKHCDINDKMHCYIDPRHVDRQQHTIAVHDKWKRENHNFID